MLSNLTITQEAGDLAYVFINPTVSAFFLTFNLLICAELIGCLGIVGNVINIMNFTKQGLHDSVNVTLTSLAVSDIGSLLFQLMVDVSWGYTDLPFTSSAGVLFFSPHCYFTRVSGYITAFAAFERCLCVVLPLKVKTIITRKVALLFNSVLFTVLLLYLFPVYYVSYLDVKYNPRTNRSVLTFVSRNNAEMVLSVSFFTNDLILPYISFLILIVCTAFIIARLRSKAQWRHSVTVANTLQSSSSKEKIFSSKEKKTIVMLTTVSVLYVALMTPGCAMITAVGFVRELQAEGKYFDLTMLVCSFTSLLETINCSVNTLVYYKMSSNYSRSTWQTEVTWYWRASAPLGGKGVSMDFSTIVLLTTIFGLLVHLWFRRPLTNYPPQPCRPLPIVGHLFTLDSDLRTQFKKWHKELGEIFSLKMAGTSGTLMVVLNGYDLIKDTLVKRAEDFTDRPPFYMDKALGSEFKGIMFSNGENWKEQRSVTLSILRNFGMGKNILAQMIQEEVTHFVDLLAQLQGAPTDMRINTDMATSNVVCTFLLGQRFEYTDATFHKFLGHIHNVIVDINRAQLVIQFPSIAKLPGDFFHARRIESNGKCVMDTIYKFIEDKKSQKSDEDAPNDFITAYLQERDRKLKSGIETNLDEENLAKNFADIIIAGTDTTTTALLWCMLYAINFQEKQEIIFQEIEKEIGLERPPSIQDRTKLVNLNAFLAESSRLASVSAHGFTRQSSTNTTIKGYTIPKGSYIVPNLDSVMHDKKIWGDDAMSFKPERFIDAEGKLQIPEQLVPFCIGRRICPGEGFANTVIFLVISALFQRFKLLPADVKSPPPLKYVFGADVSPENFDVRFLDRRAF
ncbi:Cytochrome P450 2B2 [Bulinus truncatus]|nr:Cytochrome P450 2B2 [Bulinus truncatus]